MILSISMPKMSSELNHKPRYLELVPFLVRWVKIICSGCFKLKSSLYDFQDPKYKNILYATEGHLENVPCRVVSSDNHTQLKILGQNDLTKEPVSSEIVYIEMHIQLHSATRVQWKIVEQYDSRILENKMALGKP